MTGPFSQCVRDTESFIHPSNTSPSPSRWPPALGSWTKIGSATACANSWSESSPPDPHPIIPLSTTSTTADFFLVTKPTRTPYSPPTFAAFICIDVIFL